LLLVSQVTSMVWFFSRPVLNIFMWQRCTLFTYRFFLYKEKIVLTRSTQILTIQQKKPLHLLHLSEYKGIQKINMMAR
jgi:hypothetical protein